MNKSKMKEYKCWSLMKDRCYNKNSDKYYKYGAVGIAVDEDMRQKFEIFLEEIGEMPDYDSKWSVDRIDGSLGYIKGNIRWATDEQQTRNRRKQRNNITGHTGVYWTVMNSYTYAISSWYEYVNGELKQKHKCFNSNKYGLLPSFRMAVEHRNNQICRLNNLGYGYTNNHGQ